MLDLNRTPYVSKMVCEYPLPIPVEKFSEDEKVLFESIDWSSREFFTASFYEHLDMDTILSYNITEDGDFYAEKTIISQEVDEDGKIQIKEKDGGIEKKEFTGEIYFTTDFFGDEKTNLDSGFDYGFTFQALLYKGEVKELNFYEYNKNDNKERKRMLEIMTNISEKQLRKETNLIYKIIHYLFLPFTFVLLIPYNILGRIILLINKVEVKIKSKILK